jgi:hypothetical protein
MHCRRFTVLGLALLLLTACTTGNGVQQSTQKPLPTMQGKAVVLTAATLPPQGSNYRDAGNRWQVHGVIDNAAYRYGETDPTHLFVANGRGTDWTGLAAGNSWSVSCATSGREIHCAIESPHRAATRGGFVLVDNTRCTPLPANTPMGGAGFIILGDGRPCVLDGGSTTGISDYGLAQAQSLRDWMIRIWQTSGQK